MSLMLEQMDKTTEVVGNDEEGLEGVVALLDESALFSSCSSYAMTLGTWSKRQSNKRPRRPG